VKKDESLSMDIIEQWISYWNPPKSIARKGIRSEDDSWEVSNLKSGPEVGIYIEVDEF
jgi:hypothetical protein